MKTIQTFLIVAMATLLLSSCGGGGTAETDGGAPKDVASAKANLKEKKQALNDLQKEIAELEAYIAENTEGGVKEKKVVVTTQPVVTKTFRHYVEVQGNVTTAQEPAFASSETGGRLVEMRVKEGDYVKKGDTIAKVNLESIQKSIDEIDKSLELAKDMFKRQENLWKQKIGSEVQYLQAKNQVESLEKSKERLQFELSKAHVFSPASGYVDMVMVKQGEVAGPGSPIIQILNTNQLKVIAAVPEVYLGSVKRGDQVRVTFPALGAEEEQMAKVITLGRVINSTNRTFEVEASLRSSKILKPNLLATLFLNDFERTNAVVLSDELIMQDISGKSFVMLQEGGKAVKRFVVLGRGYQNETVVEEGLTGGETLIVKGARQVVDGDQVEVIQDGVAENQ